jgi:hypothetical protein
MSTIIRWARVAAEACGGWFSIMSGALSIPFVFLALFWASPRFYFAALAYLAMGASAIGAVRRIHLLVDSHKKELAERRTAYDREKQTIEAQVESLKEQLDDRASRLSVITRLGEFRLALEIRRREINKLGAVEWEKQREDGHDIQWMCLIHEIQAYFDDHPAELGTNAWADFLCRDNIDRTPIIGACGMTIYHDQWENLQHGIAHSEKNLAKIVDQLRRNKT